MDKKGLRAWTEHKHLSGSEERTTTKESIAFLKEENEGVNEKDQKNRIRTGLSRIVKNLILYRKNQREIVKDH